MATVAAARRAALALVSERRRRSGRMRDLLRTSAHMERLDSRDRALAFRLAMGVTATERLLDELVDTYVRKPSSLQPQVRDALRIACYELCWLDTPPHVSVSQGVELVRSVAPRAASLANAVLRRVDERERPRIAEARRRCAAAAAGEPCTEDDLRLATGLPAWLVRRLVEDRGLSAAATLASGMLEPAPSTVAANLRLHDIDEAEGLLRDAGLDPRRTLPEGSFELGAPAGLAASGLVQAVDVVAADRASQLVAALTAPAPGLRVLEIGQGRSTKTVLLESAACECGGPAHIVAIDSEAYKVRLASKRMARAGLGKWVQSLALDGRQLAADDLPGCLREPFDLVFLDAPCSGSGTMRRHPEIAASLDERSVEMGEGLLPTLQLELLRAAATCVRAGGTLVYATCSALRAEDECVIDAFLSTPEGQRFAVVPATARLVRRGDDGGLAEALAPWLTREGYLLTGLCPSTLGQADTHFMALLEART